MIKPTPTRQMSAIWLSQSLPPMPVEPLIPGMSGGGGRGSWLYHEMLDADAQGIGEVKKLSKESASAADHAQMKTTSTSVCASLPEVRHRPSGRPKYSSYPEMCQTRNCTRKTWSDIRKSLS